MIEKTDILVEPRSVRRDDVRRVQVGCGPHHLRDGWWNTDLRDFPGIDEAMDACRPWPWVDQLDYVYAEHFLEHLAFEDATAFLLEAGRALRVGGLLRLTTPSLEWVLKTHFSPDNVDRATQVVDTFRINRAFHGWGHRFLYSSAMLLGLLDAVGYVDVRLCGYGQSDDPALRGLELHGDYSVDEGFPSVWIVEARRPPHAMEPDPSFRALADATFGQFTRGGH